MTPSSIHPPFFPFEQRPPEPPPSSAASVSPFLHGSDELDAYDVAYLIGGRKRVALLTLRRLEASGLLTVTENQGGGRIAWKQDGSPRNPFESVAAAAIGTSAPPGPLGWEIVEVLKHSHAIDSLRTRLRARGVSRGAGVLIPIFASLAGFATVFLALSGSLEWASTIAVVAALAGMLERCKSAVGRAALRIALERRGKEPDFLLAQDPIVPTWLQHRVPPSESSCGGGCGGCGG